MTYKYLCQNYAGAEPCKFIIIHTMVEGNVVFIIIKIEYAPNKFYSYSQNDKY